MPIDTGVFLDAMPVDTGVPVNCPADSTEPNQDQASAHVLTQNMMTENLVVCAGADDWFVLDLPYGQAMQFSACGDKSGVIPQLEFFREEFPEPRHYLGGGGPDCVSSAGWEASGKYFFRVSTDQAELKYNVGLYLAPWRRSCSNEGSVCDVTGICTGGVCVCNSDAFEPNDTGANAKPLPLNVLHALIACVENDDWFKVEATAGSTIDIHLENPGVGYYLNIAIFDDPASTTPVGFYPKVQPSEDYSYNVTTTGTYHLRAVNTSSFGVRYSIRVDVN